PMSLARAPRTPAVTSGRLSAAVVVSVACALAGCGGDEARAGVEDGEWLPGGSTTNTVLVAPASALAAPVPDLDFEQRQAFFSGNSFFTNAWVTAPSSTSARDGLGPLFKDRKSTRLNSSHVKISYAVFCLKKKIYNAQSARDRFPL